MAQVFISYSRRDKDFARKLADALAEQKRDTWADWKDIPLTAEWHQEILTNIEAADYFVFVISPDSIASAVCRQEIEHAGANNKRMVPIFCREVADQDVPPSLAKFQRIDFREADQFDSQFATLIKALETDLPWIQAHTRLLIRATEWERAARDSSFLLRGTDLHDAERWLTTSHITEPRPTPLHTQYILLSRQAATRRQRIVFASVAIAGVVAGGLAVYGYMTDRLKEDALSRSLAGKSAALLARGGDANLAALLALESVRRSPTDDGAQALRDALVYLRKVRSFEGGNKDLSQLVFSPDATRLVALARSDDRLAHVFATDTGKELTSLRHDGDVTRAVFSPDGRLLLTGSTDKMARLWDAGSGKELQRLVSDSEVMAVALGSQGLVAAGNKTGALVWDPQTGRELARLDHADPVRVVAFSPSGRWFASGASDGSVQLWDRSDASRKALPQQEKTIRALAFNPADERQLLVVSADDDSRGDLIILDLGTAGVLAHASFLENNPPTRVVYSADRERILMSGSGYATVWDLQLKPLFKPHSQSVGNRALLSVDGRLFVTADDESLRIFDVRDVLSGKEIARVPLTGNLAAMEPSADGRFLATVGDGTIRIVDLHSQIESLRWPRLGPISQITFSADGRWAAVASSPIWLADLQRPWEPPQELKSTSDRGHSADAAALTRDGSRLATANQTQLAVWDTHTAQIVGNGDLPGGSVPAPLFFSANASRVLLGLPSAGMKAFDWATGAWSGGGDNDQARAISADMRLMALRPDDHTIRIVEADTKRETTALSKEFAPYVVSFGGNDKLLLGVDQNEGVAQLWDLGSRKLLAKVADVDRVSAAALTPDGRLVATTTGDTVRFQLWRIDELTTYACGLVTRPITPKEWKQYLPEVAYAGSKTCAGFGSGRTR